ncbi:hypothetical protein [Ruegeria marina]|uniref:Uncharacterized protein n=1 Tax=Ruegeria marina TaxID=639004 RepID=A0A1G6VE57_9RHOB|nr:hypothetical protein SAMN04488239_10834 [Ruegeria marina]
MLRFRTAPVDRMNVRFRLETDLRQRGTKSCADRLLTSLMVLSRHPALTHMRH